jgi:stearoyl-CoA desaturase (delta-9 desaturase)
MYYSKFRHLVPEAQYQLLAGSDWPGYRDYLEYRESADDAICNEMEQTLATEITNLYTEYKRQRLRKLKNNLLDGIMYHVWRAFIPGVVGLMLYFYLGGTLTKFFVIALICFVLNFVYGVTLHRWLTHRQFEPKSWARPFLLFLVTLAGFGHLAAWTGVHLIHHRHSDSDKDPHPVKNGFWNTLLMVTNVHPSMANDPVFSRKVDKDVGFVAKHFWKLHLCSLAIVAFIDIDFFLLSFLMIKSVVVLQNGIINYLGHNNKDNPQITNIKWLSIFINGENWHKNHHANAKRFKQSDPGCLDLGYYAVKIFVKNER